MYSLFTIEINLGNASHAQDRDDVADKLRMIANELDRSSEPAGAIRDANGNKVGRYRFE